MTYFKVLAGIIASANISICSLFEQHFLDISADVLKSLNSSPRFGKKEDYICAMNLND